MAKEGRRPPSGSSAVPGVREKARVDQPFDHWLHKQLHEMYDSIASEPLPDDLMKLIDSDAESTLRSRQNDGSSEDSDQ